MASDPRLDPRNILTARLAAGEQIRVVVGGSRLCPDFRLSGPVAVSAMIGHSIGHAARGGTWVPGIWAVSDRSLHYVSKRSWFGWHGGQAFDVTIPLRSIIGIEQQKGMRRVRYKIFYPGGTTKLSVATAEAEKIVPLLKAATTHGEASHAT